VLNSVDKIVSGRRILTQKKYWDYTSTFFLIKYLCFKLKIVFIKPILSVYFLLPTNLVIVVESICWVGSI